MKEQYYTNIEYKFNVLILKRYNPVYLHYLFSVRSIFRQLQLQLVFFSLEILVLKFSVTINIFSLFVSSTCDLYFAFTTDPCNETCPPSPVCWEGSVVQS